MTKLLPFGWRTVDTAPPAPGKYDSIKILHVDTDRWGKSTFTFTREYNNTWDGKAWDKPLTGWREQAFQEGRK